MILITGTSGFLGGHLVRHLSAKGQKIRALYHSNAPDTEQKKLSGVEWKKCDLLDIFDVEEVFEGITHVYHCAAMVSFDPAHHEQMLHFNPESTTNIVNQALVQGITKMVYVSSVSAIGRTDDPIKLITEEEEWGESQYNSAYGLSKYLAETEMWRGIGEGLNAVIINPGIILGAGNWDKGSAQLMSVVNNEFPFYTKGVTAWVDVEDVVKIMGLLMESNFDSERYIISCGNHAYKEVFTIMAQELNKKPPGIYANNLVTGMAWRASSLISGITKKNKVITRETALNAHSVSTYDNSKFLTAFPNFSYTPLKQTISKMAKEFKTANHTK